MKMCILIFSISTALNSIGQHIPDLQFTLPDTIADGQYMPKFIFKNKTPDANRPIENDFKIRFVCQYFKGAECVLLHYLNTDKIFYPDLASFEVIQPPHRIRCDYFSKDKNHIYFLGEPITNDTGGFAVLGKFGSNWDTANVIWKTNAGIYLNQYLTKIPNNHDFRSIEPYSVFFKDNRSLYYRHHPIENSHPATGHVINSEYAYDSLNVYHKDRIFSYKEQKTYPINSSLMKTDQMVYHFNGYIFIEMKNIDVKTLKRLSDHYSMDKNFIYYDTFQLRLNRNNLNKIKIWDNEYHKFITDGIRLYDHEFISKIRLDLNTFEAVPKTNLLADKTGVYKWRDDEQRSFTKIPFSYQFPLKASEIKPLKNGFVQYKRQIYSFNEDTVYKNLNEQSIQTLLTQYTLNPQQQYIPGIHTRKIKLFRDKVWLNNRPTNIDLNSLKVINRFHLKDTHFVYRINYDNEPTLQRLVELDANTTSTLNSFIIDKNGLYFGDYRIISSENLNILAYEEHNTYRSCGNELSKTPSFHFYLMHNKDGYWLVSIKSKKEVSIRFIGTELPSE